MLCKWETKTKYTLLAIRQVSAYLTQIWSLMVVRRAERCYNVLKDNLELDFVKLSSLSHVKTSSSNINLFYNLNISYYVKSYSYNHNERLYWPLPINFCTIIYTIIYASILFKNIKEWFLMVLVALLHYFLTVH